MAYAAVFLFDMAQAYRWRDTTFDPEFAWVGRFVLPACMAALALFSAGFMTRVSAIASFLLFNFVYHHLRDTYALDRITLLVLFVFAFAPAPKALALDVWLRKAKSRPLEIVPGWFAISLLLCIEAVYGISVLYKLRCTIWRDGIAVWLPVTFPPFSSGRLPHQMESTLVLRAASYLTLAFEALFPLVLLKPLRRWMVMLGICLHVGIATFLPIPCFGLAFASLYLFLIDWEPVARRLGWAEGTAVEAAPREASRAPLARLAYALPVFLAAGDAVAIVPAKFVPPFAGVQRYLAEIGLVRYAVYMDFNFTVSKPIVRFVVKAGDRVIDAPTYDERGYPLLTGRFWCWVTIGDLRLLLGEPAGDAQVNRYLRGALTRDGITDAEFSIYGRDVTIPLRMDPAMPDEIARRPWQLIASGVYRDGHSVITWKPGVPLATAGRVP